MELYKAMHKVEDRLLSVIHPLAFAAKANNDDMPNYYQTMNGPDAEGFYKGKLDLWEIVPESDVPLGANHVLDSTWAFKRKQYPDGSVRKLKARWCVRGDQQIKGVALFDIFAPVVAWLMVRLLLILTVVLWLATKQVDYTNTFCKADLDDEVYV
jgi:Reverse transcriptase (RNA-dependent DNA polymerase)